MDIIGILIGIGIVGIIVIAILLKICSKSEIFTFICMCASAIGLIVSSFIMPEKKGYADDTQTVYGLIQALCIFLFYVTSYADIVFDREEYVSSRGYEDSRGNIHVESRLETRSFFWSTLGIGAVIAAILTAICHGVFPAPGIALGIIGCLALAWTVFRFIKERIIRYRYRHPKDYY